MPNTILPPRFAKQIVRAQGVRRKNFKLDLMLGSLIKQRIGIRFANSTHPYC
jgi:hypothetical protein